VQNVTLKPVAWRSVGVIALKAHAANASTAVGYFAGKTSK
jgi:hypothetical protein